jgi:hypothetical protein
VGRFVAFLEDARRQGAAIFSVLRTQPFMRPFNWQRGSSLYDGVFEWRDPLVATVAERLKRLRDRNCGRRCATRSIIPTPTARTARPCRRRRSRTVFVDVSRSDPGAVGKSLVQLAAERRRARRRHHGRAGRRRRSRDAVPLEQRERRLGRRPTPTPSATRT